MTTFTIKEIVSVVLYRMAEFEGYGNWVKLELSSRPTTNRMQYSTRKRAVKRTRFQELSANRSSVKSKVQMTTWHHFPNNSLVSDRGFSLPINETCNFLTQNPT